MTSTYTNTRTRQVSLYKPPRNPPRDPYADIISLIASVLTKSAKLDGAACVAQPDLFSTDASQEQQAEAIAICSTCPAFDACRDWANSLPPGHVSGVVAAQVRKPRYPLSREKVVKGTGQKSETPRIDQREQPVLGIR